MATNEGGTERPIWYMRIKQGGGKATDFAEALWQPGKPTGLVGIFFGGWKLEDVQVDGQLDKDLLRKETLQDLHDRAQDGKRRSWTLGDGHVSTVRRFLSEADDTKDVQPGHRVVVSYVQKIKRTDGRRGKEKVTWLAVGTIGEGPLGHPTDLVGMCDAKGIREFLKCRPVVNKKEFDLRDLPSCYRLVRGTGRGTLQQIDAYKNMVELLFQAERAEEVRSLRKRALTEGDEPDLSMLSDGEWETVCQEWLRAKKEYKNRFRLLLAVGRSLEALDIVGSVGSDVLVLGQCKNGRELGDSDREKLLDDLRAAGRAAGGREAELFLFSRGDSSQLEGDVKVVGADTIGAWLRDKELAYLEALADL